MNTIRKPKEWAPCNGCGLCCIAEICPTGKRAFPDHPEDKRCPALMWEGPKARCAIMLTDATYAVFMGQGAGCDSNFPDGWTAADYEVARSAGTLPEFEGA